jgi:hypothetical protein
MAIHWNDIESAAQAVSPRGASPGLSTATLVSHPAAAPWAMSEARESVV